MILCGKQTKASLQGAGSWALSPTRERRVQMCLPLRSIASACQGRLHCCRRLLPVRAGADRSGQTASPEPPAPAFADLRPSWNLSYNSPTKTGCSATLKPHEYWRSGVIWNRLEPFEMQVWLLGRGLMACKRLKRLAPQVGLEPTTLRLTAGCYTGRALILKGVTTAPNCPNRPKLGVLLDNLLDKCCSPIGHRP